MLHVSWHETDTTLVGEAVFPATKANAAKKGALLLRAEGRELPLQRDKYERLNSTKLGTFALTGQEGSIVDFRQAHSFQHRFASVGERLRLHEP